VSDKAKRVRWAFIIGRVQNTCHEKQHSNMGWIKDEEKRILFFQWHLKKKYKFAFQL